MTSEPTTSSALIVVDLQQSTLPNARAAVSADWLANVMTLIEAFRERELPVVIATSLGTPPGRTSYADSGRDWPAGATALASEITPADSDIRIERRGLSVFVGTDLATILRAADVAEVVIVGIATSFGVESSARAGYDLGFDVVVVSDAIADLRRASMDHSLAHVLPVVGRVRTTADVLGTLVAPL
ncbi:isochorismatase family cysteine hydrolase [Microbacterium pumilum]|uniref:Isochorismatase family protein n=1 Tax=Microbacterium pumilum TaxID=344165 RepID=A0ABN2RNP8_9MICO